MTSTELKDVSHLKEKHQKLALLDDAILDFEEFLNATATRTNEMIQQFLNPASER